MFSPYGLFNLMDNGFSALFCIVFIGVIAIIIFGITSSIKESMKNNASPVLTVDTFIVTKRQNDTHHTTVDANNNTSTHFTTDYYVTFQVESGDRLEFIVSGKEYGMMAENDRGKLTFQGTRFLGFQRI